MKNLYVIFLLLIGFMPKSAFAEFPFHVQPEYSNYPKYYFPANDDFETVFYNACNINDTLNKYNLDPDKKYSYKTFYFSPDSSLVWIHLQTSNARYRNWFLYNGEIREFTQNDFASLMPLDSIATGFSWITPTLTDSTHIVFNVKYQNGNDARVFLYNAVSDSIKMIDKIYFPAKGDSASLLFKSPFVRELTKSEFLLGGDNLLYGLAQSYEYLHSDQSAWKYNLFSYDPLKNKLKVIAPVNFIARKCVVNSKDTIWLRDEWIANTFKNGFYWLSTGNSESPAGVRVSDTLHVYESAKDTVYEYALNDYSEFDDNEMQLTATGFDGSIYVINKENELIIRYPDGRIAEERRFSDNYYNDNTKNSLRLVGDREGNVYGTFNGDTLILKLTSDGEFSQMDLGPEDEYTQLKLASIYCSKDQPNSLCRIYEDSAYKYFYAVCKAGFDKKTLKTLRLVYDLNYKTSGVEESRRIPHPYFEKLYLSPFGGELTAEIAGCNSPEDITSIKIYTYDGREVIDAFSEFVFSGDSYNAVIKTGELPAGVYLIAAKGAACNVSKKFIVK